MRLINRRLKRIGTCYVNELTSLMDGELKESLRDCADYGGVTYLEPKVMMDVHYAYPIRFPGAIRGYLHVGNDGRITRIELLDTHGTGPGLGIYKQSVNDLCASYLGAEVIDEDISILFS